MKIAMVYQIVMKMKIVYGLLMAYEDDDFLDALDKMTFMKKSLNSKSIWKKRIRL